MFQHTDSFVFCTPPAPSIARDPSINTRVYPPYSPAPSHTIVHQISIDPAEKRRRPLRICQSAESDALQVPPIPFRLPPSLTGSTPYPARPVHAIPHRQRIRSLLLTRIPTRSDALPGANLLHCASSLYKHTRPPHLTGAPSTYTLSTRLRPLWICQRAKSDAGHAPPSALAVLPLRPAVRHTTLAPSTPRTPRRSVSL